jgi:hypothetical protein
VAAADAMAQEVREEVSRVGVKVAAELAKSTTEFERRADVLSADKERGESARLSLQRQVEARCTEMEQLVLILRGIWWRCLTANYRCRACSYQYFEALR